MSEDLLSLMRQAGSDRLQTSTSSYRQSLNEVSELQRSSRVRHLTGNFVLPLVSS